MIKGIKIASYSFLIKKQAVILQVDDLISALLLIALFLIFSKRNGGFVNEFLDVDDLFGLCFNSTIAPRGHINSFGHNNDSVILVIIPTNDTPVCSSIVCSVNSSSGRNSQPLFSKLE